MADEFYLPEDTVEWIGQKKSELLAWILDTQSMDDIQVEDHENYAHRIPETLSHPDESWLQRWDGYEVIINLKMFQEKDHFWMFTVAMKSPVMNQADGEVLVPILAIPTWERKWLSPWLNGEPQGGAPLQ